MDLRDRVLAVQQAYVDAALGKQLVRDENPVMAAAIAGAIASQYLAVSTPRSFALIGDDASAALSLAAHGVWFAPKDIRSVGNTVGRAVSLDEALAADLVCAHVPLSLAVSQLRRGTHVNALAGATLDDELAALARVTVEVPGLGRLAAGIVDGRSFDEITIFII